MKTIDVRKEMLEDEDNEVVIIFGEPADDAFIVDLNDGELFNLTDHGGAEYSLYFKDIDRMIKALNEVKKIRAGMEDE